MRLPEYTVDYVAWPDEVILTAVAPLGPNESRHEQIVGGRAAAQRPLRLLRSDEPADMGGSCGERLKGLDEHDVKVFARHHQAKPESSL